MIFILICGTVQGPVAQEVAVPLLHRVVNHKILVLHHDNIVKYILRTYKYVMPVTVRIGLKATKIRS